MTDRSLSMSPERFAALAEAYGSVLDRWPAAERDAAARLAETEAGRSIIAEARRLDRVLETYRVPEPTSALTGRVLADANGAIRRRRLIRRWWAGLGLAGVGLAGAVLAATVVTVILPSPAADSAVVADSGAWGTDDLEWDMAREAL